jgi:uncharacterized protein (TIGR03437 family)
MQPNGVAIDQAGNLFIADYSDARVRRVSQGVISTFAGCDPVNPICVLAEPGDLAAATSVVIQVSNIAVDTAGNLYVTDNGYQRVREVSPAGVLTNLAGTGQAGINNGALNNPSGIAVDRMGNLYVADTGNHRVLKIFQAGGMATLAGNGTPGFGGDGGQASGALLSSPNGAAVDVAGNLYIADTGNNRVRKVATTGVMTTIAGGAACCNANDGGPAANAFLAGPKGVAIDGANNVYIADTNSSRIRKIDANGIITTIAGTGVPGFSGDSGPANLAVLNGPAGISFDLAGNLYLADTGNNVVRKIIGAGVSTAQPAISAVVSGASFAPGIAPGSWLTIQGTGLAQTTRGWASADFVGSNLPQTLDGVSVNIDGLPAYVAYVSPTQLNVLSPDDAASGPVRVQVFTSQGNNVFTASLAPFTPALFLFTAKYPAAVHADGTLVGNTGLLAGGAFAPAKPGETIELFGTGFGLTTPPTAAGKLVTAPQPLANQVFVTVGGLTAPVTYAGVTESGLDQINVTLPPGLQVGDAALSVMVAGVSVPGGLVLTIGN